MEAPTPSIVVTNEPPDSAELTESVTAQFVVKNFEELDSKFGNYTRIGPSEKSPKFYAHGIHNPRPCWRRSSAKWRVAGAIASASVTMPAARTSRRRTMMTHQRAKRSSCEFTNSGVAWTLAGSPPTATAVFSRGGSRLAQQSRRGPELKKTGVRLRRL